MHLLTCDFRGYSLLVMRIKSLTSLGLRSLRRINDGRVYITGNTNLCYYETVNWTRILNFRLQKRVNIDIRNNRLSDECGESHLTIFNLIVDHNTSSHYFLFLLLCVQLRTAICATPCAHLMAAGVPDQTSVFPVRSTAGEGLVCRTACS